MPAATDPSTTPPPALHEPEPLQPVAAVLAVLLPGAGHLYLGYTRRAILIASGVLGLFFSGLFVGGIDTVDRREDFVWFIGQAFVGPTAFAVDYIHQHEFKVIDPHSGIRSAHPDEYRDPRTGAPVRIIPDPARGPTATIVDANDPTGAHTRTISPARPPNIKSLGRMNELGTLFSTIAGMLNLICIIDAAAAHRRRRGGAPA